MGVAWKRLVWLHSGVALHSGISLLHAGVGNVGGGVVELVRGGVTIHLLLLGPELT